MKTNQLTDFFVDKDHKKIQVKREFAANLSKVWAAWTDSTLLDQWWAPKPWQAKTKKMDFREGGYWLYSMIGPEGEEQFCRTDFLAISPFNSFKIQDAFCDENGKIDESFPSALWTNEFTEKEDTTMVSIEITYEQLSDLETIMKMGFQEGLTAGLENLDELLET